jgi:predicted amidohydrolase
MFERVGETIYNTTSVIDPSGTVIGRHRRRVRCHVVQLRPHMKRASCGSV